MEVWKALPYVGYSMFDFDARIPPGEDRAGRVLLGVFHRPIIGSPSTKGHLRAVPNVFGPAFKATQQNWVVARMRLIGRTRFDECKHPGRASLVGSRAANYRALFWLPDAFEPLSE